MPDIGTTTLDCVAGMITEAGTFTYPVRLWFKVTVKVTEWLELTRVTVSVAVPAALSVSAAGVTSTAGNGVAVTFTVVDPELYPDKLAVIVALPTATPVTLTTVASCPIWIVAGVAT